MAPRTRGADGRQTVRALFLGRLGKRKGCYDLIEAIAMLPPRQRERLRVVLAGDGDVEGVAASAARAGISHLVDFPGWIDPQARAGLLAGADMVLLPSHEEGLPMAVLEGMAAGRLVITTPVGGIPEVVTDGRNGLLVEPGAVSALSEALGRAIDDAELRHRLGEAAARTSASFGIDLWYENLAHIWADVAAVGRRGSRRG